MSKNKMNLASKALPWTRIHGYTQGHRDINWLEHIRDTKSYFFRNQISQSGYWYNVSSGMLEFWIVAQERSFGCIRKVTHVCYFYYSINYLKELLKKGSVNMIQLLTKAESNLSDKGIVKSWTDTNFCLRKDFTNGIF